MRNFRIAVFFLLAALSFARAQCEDFAIQANVGATGSGSSFAATVMFDDELMLFVSPQPPGATFQWFIDNSTTVVSTGAFYSPELTVNPAMGATIQETYTAKCTEGSTEVTKTIIVTVTHRISHKVLFDTDYGTPRIDSQFVLLGKTASEPKDVITKPGFDFNGWDFNFNTAITKDTTIKARWQPKEYTITFSAGRHG